MDDLPAQRDAGSTTDPASNPPPPPQINRGTPVDPEPERQSSQRKRYRRLRHAPIWIEAACALALVGITAFYTHYAKQQRDAILSGNWSSQQSADAATTASNAAKRAADTAVQTMHIDERAWINVTIGQAAMVDGQPLVMPIGIVNEGKTIAFNLSGRMVVNVLPINDEPDFVYKPGHPTYALNTKALLPNRPQNASYAALPKYAKPGKAAPPIIVDPTLRNKIADGSLYIVVHLRITYDDIFGVSHWQQFLRSR